MIAMKNNAFGGIPVETRLAYLRPEQILERLYKMPVAYIPLGPLEWHGPHLPLGVDPLNAEQVALAACARTGGVVWPTLFWGTERERSPDILKNLGFTPDQYIVGMDFPGNPVPSAYCREETFGLLVRETLELVLRMGARYAVIVNGHGATNHGAVLQRLAEEFNRTTALRVLVRMAMPQRKIEDGTIAHAGRDETSLMLFYSPDTVSLASLPPANRPLRYQDFAIVDGPGFEGKGRPDRVVADDPRTETSAEKGKDLFEMTVSELVATIRDIVPCSP
jgi:creatinine amidohydrolase